MGKLPRLKNNAFLKVYFDVEGIYAHLAYSHIEEGESFIKSKFIPYSVELGEVEDRDFNRYIWELLKGLEEFFEWEMFQSNAKDTSGVGQQVTHGRELHAKDRHDYALALVEAAEKGVGISGIEVKISDLISPKKGIVSAVRDVVAVASVKVTNNELYAKVASQFAEKFSYSDVIWLDMNVGSCMLLRVQSIENSAQIKEFAETEFWVNKHSEAEMLEYCQEPLVKNFMIENVPNISSLRNYWVNFILSSSFYTESQLVQDVLRAVNTSRFYSKYHGSGELENFGVHEYLPSDHKSLDGFALIVTGGLTRTIPENDLLLSIMDSLELKGYFDMFIDRDERLVSFGESYFRGIDAEDIVVNRSYVVPVAKKVIIPELPGFGGGRKVVMSGRLSKAGEAAEEIFCVTPEVREYTLPGDNCVLEGNLVKGAKLSDIGNRIEHTFIGEYLKFDKVIFDCRFRPIVYGPDAKANRLKMAQWFNE